MPRLFDAYIMVDWSAAAKPVTGLNSIWIGVLAKDARLNFQFQAANPDTRLKANDFLKRIIAKLTGRGDKILLGFDFSLGYPAGTAAALGLDTSTRAPWTAMHDHLAAKLRDKPDNSNARFAIAAGMNYAISKGPFPFWGAPSRDQMNTLSGTKPSFDNGALLPEYRIVEERLRDSGVGQPKSGWQLAYTGSVGSQSLTGIPHVHDLLKTIDGARIWPFETGLCKQSEETLADVSVLVAEVYPSLLNIAPEPSEVTDLAQVRTIARHYCDLDEKDGLGAAFGPPDGFDMTKIPQVECEEGWILGA